MRHDLLKIVIVGELIASHDAAGTGEQRHARLSTHSPLDHLAVGFTRVIDESSNSPTSRIDDHFVVEAHEIIALQRISGNLYGKTSTTYLVFLVDLFHAPLAFRLMAHGPRRKMEHAPKQHSQTSWE